MVGHTEFSALICSSLAIHSLAFFWPLFFLNSRKVSLDFGWENYRFLFSNSASYHGKNCSVDPE